MDKIIKISNLNYSYGEKKLFKHFSLSIAYQSFTTIIGPNGSGKTTLARLLYGILDSKESIIIKDLTLNSKNIKMIRKKIGIVFDNSSSLFGSKTIKEDMEVILKSYGYNKKQITKKIEAASKTFDLEHLLEFNANALSNGERQLVALAIASAHDPEMIILDDALGAIAPLKREKIFKILKEMQKIGITIINFTHDSEDILKGTDVILLDNGQVKLQSKVEDAFHDVSIFTQSFISLPFVVDLSIKLQYYHVINKIYFDMKQLEEAIWK